MYYGKKLSIKNKYMSKQIKILCYKASHLSALMFNVFIKNSPALWSITTEVSCNLLALTITVWVQKDFTEMHHPCLTDKRILTSYIKTIYSHWQGRKFNKYFLVISKIKYLPIIWLVKTHRKLQQVLEFENKTS